MKYIYTKDVHHKTVLTLVLNDVKFKANIERITKKGSNNIEIDMKTSLTGSEELRLGTAISNLSLVDNSILIASNMEKITKFTEKLIRDFGEKNLERGYNESQIRALTSQLSEVMALLNGKALPTALTVLSSMTPSSELTALDINEFSQKIIDFLAGL